MHYNNTSETFPCKLESKLPGPLLPLLPPPPLLLRYFIFGILLAPQYKTRGMVALGPAPRARTAPLVPRSSHRKTSILYRYHPTCFYCTKYNKRMLFFKLKRPRPIIISSIYSWKNSYVSKIQYQYARGNVVLRIKSHEANVNVAMAGHTAPQCRIWSLDKTVHFMYVHTWCIFRNNKRRYSSILYTMRDLQRTSLRRSLLLRVENVSCGPFCISLINI